MSNAQGSKMLQLVSYRMRVAVQDGRQMVGEFMAFDRHMNLVLGDCEELRWLPPPSKLSKASGDREDQRTLGLVILRGEEVISMAVEGPAAPRRFTRQGWWRRRRSQGPEVGRAAGRGGSLRRAPPGPARAGRPRARCRRARARHDAAADLAPAGPSAAGVLRVASPADADADAVPAPIAPRPFPGGPPASQQFMRGPVLRDLVRLEHCYLRGQGCRRQQ